MRATAVVDLGHSRESLSACPDLITGNAGGADSVRPWEGHPVVESPTAGSDLQRNGGGIFGGHLERNSSAADVGINVTAGPV